MYSSCIFCARPLGANDTLETFPVGHRLAFDAWRGRLWAVCPRCGRWNLAPIEERWEALEASEKAFRAARLRVQSENIGLARLPDGTDLIRIGRALPGELAAWRYGERLLRRRRHGLVIGGAAAAAGLGLAGLWAAGAVSFFGAWIAADLVQDVVRRRGERRTVHLLGPCESPTGEALRVQEAHLAGSRLELDDRDSLVLHLPGHARRSRSFVAPPIEPLPELTLRDDAARNLVRRVMVHVNERGGSRRLVEDAVSRLAAAGDPEALILETARQGVDLGGALASVPLLELPGIVRVERARRRRGGQWVRRARRSDRKRAAPGLLALEMALNEESERRALQGELALLEDAWREAEEIAAIADALPDDRIVLPPRLRAEREETAEGA